MKHAAQLIKRVGGVFEAEEYIKSLFGEEALEALRSDQVTELKSENFSIIKKPDALARQSNPNACKFYLRHEGDGGEIQVIGKNAERLYFAALVDNHLFKQSRFVRYEESDKDQGRTDVVVKTGRGAGAPICILVENKNCSSSDFDSKRSDAINQAVKRIQSFEKELTKEIAITLCFFDPQTVDWSSAGSYYSNKANDVAAKDLTIP